MKFFGISELEIKHLKALDLTEAEWRIRHEHKAMLGWTDRRRDFLLGEVRVNPPKPRPPPAGPVAPRHAKVTSIAGERLA